jgi:hypothetical protein
MASPARRKTTVSVRGSSLVIVLGPFAEAVRLAGIKTDAVARDDNLLALPPVCCLQGLLLVRVVPADRRNRSRSPARLRSSSISRLTGW